MDSIIFDLDGTLWNSIGTVAIAWNEVIKKSNYVEREVTERAFEQTMGLPFQEIAQKLFPELDEQKQKQILAECCEVENAYLEKHGGNLYPQVEETLKELSKKYKLYIVSNCQTGYIEAFYNYHKLDAHFIDFENPGRTGLSKGENIKLIMKRNKLKSPVYVGDTQGDFQAAQYAGIPFVYASYGFGEVEAPDYTIGTFQELKELF
ncbi:HAD family hydrolase [Priestia flexa]|uniref:HAD family hydrolase n=1 Tax=Priestia flexa TaxID=86664 RepID=UPI001F3E07A2|nr:HAD family hydrolase [Priestia flexa]UIR30190.1 HAD family hydrolase [Priestia flexa]